jgi:hypothetical protein
VILFHGLASHIVRGRQLNLPATDTHFLTESSNKHDVMLAKCNELFKFSQGSTETMHHWFIQENLITSFSANFIFHLISIGLRVIIIKSCFLTSLFLYYSFANLTQRKLWYLFEIIVAAIYVNNWFKKVNASVRFSFSFVFNCEFSTNHLQSNPRCKSTCKETFWVEHVW